MAFAHDALATPDRPPTDRERARPADIVAGADEDAILTDVGAVVASGPSYPRWGFQPIRECGRRLGRQFPGGTPVDAGRVGRRTRDAQAPR